MSDGVVSVAANASILDAAKILINCHVSAIPVVDEDGRMIGIVSEADLVHPKGADRARLFSIAAESRVTDGYLSAQACKITEVMTQEVLTAPEDTPLPELARLMALHKVKRLPIVRGESVVGMVSRVDLLRALVVASSSRSADVPFNRDNELRREVTDACQGRGWSQAKQLDVVVSGGVAHLWGVVPSDLVRNAYRAAAENVPGIKSAHVHMQVVPPKPTRVGL